MVKTQCNLKIDQDILDRFRKICYANSAELSYTTEKLYQDYIERFDGGVFSKRVASYTYEKSPNCECGHQICSLWERCIYCGRYTSWTDCKNREGETNDERDARLLKEL